MLLRNIPLVKFPKSPQIDFINVKCVQVLWSTLRPSFQTYKMVYCGQDLSYLLVVLLCLAMVRLDHAALRGHRNHNFSLSSIAFQQFHPGMVDKLLKFGSVADIDYEIRVNHRPPGTMCDDLRYKIWVSVHISNQNRNNALITVMRLDSSLTANVSHHDQRCPYSSAWDSCHGWPVPIQLYLTSHGLIFDLPINLHYDVMQIKVSVPGLSPVQAQVMEIPRKIIQVTMDHKDVVPSIVIKLSSALRILNPNYEYHAFALDELASIVEEMEGAAVRDTINTLQPAAYKVDLFRVVALHHLGGFYCDSKVVPIVPLDRMLPSAGGFFPWDRGIFRGIWNGVLAMPKGDIMMRNCIDAIKHNVQQRYYGPDDLSITGPGLVYNIYSSLDFKTRLKYSATGQLDFKGVFISRDIITPLLIIHNFEYRVQMNTGNHCRYAAAWYSRAVYGEYPCDPSLGYPKCAAYHDRSVTSDDIYTRLSWAFVDGCILD